jgi:hypothetical protein
MQGRQAVRFEKGEGTTAKTVGWKISIFRGTLCFLSLREKAALLRATIYFCHSKEMEY